jgi:hypothetical protein
MHRAIVDFSPHHRVMRYARHTAGRHVLCGAVRLFAGARSSLRFVCCVALADASHCRATYRTMIRTRDREVLRRQLLNGLRGRQRRERSGCAVQSFDLEDIRHLDRAETATVAMEAHVGQEGVSGSGIGGPTRCRFTKETQEEWINLQRQQGFGAVWTLYHHTLHTCSYVCLSHGTFRLSTLLSNCIRRLSFNSNQTSVCVLRHYPRP